MARQRLAPGTRLAAVAAVGRDRPGIVAALSGALYESGCNLEDASSTILGGHFAMMLLVEIPPGVAVEAVEEAIEAAGRRVGVRTSVHLVDEAHGEALPSTHVVSVYGADRPGIVFRVAEALAEERANITALRSRVVDGEGGPVYALLLEVAAPDPAALERALDGLRDRLAVEVSLHSIDADVL